LNGLTAQVQNFATGTSGTDFGISSASTTHTFNLPTASATNRGALSSGDWTTFNGKFNTPTGTTSQYVRGDGSLATFPTTGTVTTVSATVPSPASPALSVNVSNPTTTPAIAITANGTTSQYVRGDGSLATLPNLPTIYKSTTDAGNYSGTANTVVFTQAVPANTFAAGDIIRVNFRTRKTGTGGTQTLRIYVNTTANLSGTPILVGSFANAGAPSYLVNQMLRHLVIKTSTNNTEVYFAPGLGYFIDYNIYDLTTTAAINWTISQNFVFAIQNNNAVDVNFGSMFLIEKL
jgi:hypothetical protein